MRWAQSAATPPHCPVQSPVRCATVPCPLPCFSLSQGCQWHMADWPQATYNRREQLGQSPGPCTSLDRLCSHVLHSRAGMGWGLSLPWEGRAQICLRVTHTARASPMGVDINQQINVVLSSESQDKSEATYLVCSFWRSLDFHKVFLMISLLLIHRLEEMFSELPWESNTPCHSDSEKYFFSFFVYFKDTKPKSLNS